VPFDKDGCWRPNKKQEIFLSLPESIKEALYGGGNGSGKSEVLLVYPIVRGWYTNSRFKQVFMRRTYPELRNEIVPRSKEFYLKLGATFNKSEMSWCFPRPDQYGGNGSSNSGAMIYLAHCENEDDVHNYDSMEINLFTPDEVTSLTEWIYLYIALTRVRTSDRTLPAITRAAGMPGNIGHTFIKSRFVFPNPKGESLIIGKGGVKRMYVHSTLADNPKIDPEYKNSLEALPEAEKNARLYGSWDAYLGQVFEEFRDKHYPDEPENACHIVEPFEIPDWWPKIVSIDWGYAPPAMTWVGYGAISPDKRVYIYREQAFQKTKIEEWAAFVRDFTDVEMPRSIKLCKSAGQDRGQEHTILEQISTALNRSVELTTNTPGSRVAGKALLHEYLRWKPKHTNVKQLMPFDEEHSRWLLRNKGLREYNAYLSSFNPPEDELNLPKLRIFRGQAPLLVDAIKACIYDKTNPEDVAAFPGDDAYDGVRYLIDAADKFFEEASDEFKKVQKTDELVKRLEHNQDWNAFYRGARLLESGDEIQPVSRYHGRR
jgi:hypothetical protein